MNPVVSSKLPRTLLLFLATYAVALFVCLPRLSLWLDEILTLLDARQPDSASVIHAARYNAGATPIALLVPSWIMRLLGYSLFSARLYSVLFSLGACIAIYYLAKRLNLVSPILAVIVFALCPLQFRYAIEVRPYAMGLCLTAWSTVVFLSLRENPKSWKLAILYGVLTVVGAYTIVYTLFVPAAHLASLVASHKNRRLIIVCGLALTIGCLALLPWYFYVREIWKSAIAIQQMGFMIDWRALSVLFHELTGAGYEGTALIVIGVVWGLLRIPQSYVRKFWICYALLPILFTPIADFVLNYFFAIRQTIYVLVPLAILFVAGSEAMGRKGKILVGLFLAASLYEDGKWLIKPREDWQSAASLTADQVRQKACVIFIPSSAERLYRFFDRQLGENKCPDETASTNVVLAVSAYSAEPELSQVRQKLATGGMVQKFQKDFHGPEIVLYTRP